MLGRAIGGISLSLALVSGCTLTNDLDDISGYSAPLAQTGGAAGAPTGASGTSMSDSGSSSSAGSQLTAGAPAQPEATCNADTDCASRNCVDGSCAAPTCSDGIKNQPHEVGIDCGVRRDAAGCGLCGDYKQCTSPDHCLSGVCATGNCGEAETCCQPPSCGDGVRNGAESDIDCGTFECGPCEPGSMCSRREQCKNFMCSDGYCLNFSCSDHFQNGGESDVDCGDACAPNLCDVGERCSTPDDCQSGLCDDGSGLCVAPSCTDGLINLGETDLECGGDACRNVQRCNSGQKCEIDDDCKSGACKDGRCCGGTTTDCSRCAEELSENVHCSQCSDDFCTENCPKILECLSVTGCHPLSSCGGTNQICDANQYGGTGSTAYKHAMSVLEDAGCEL